MSDSATPWTVVSQAPLSMKILQARILEWVAIFFSRGSSLPRNQTGSLALEANALPSELLLLLLSHFSRVRLCATP